MADPNSPNIAGETGEPTANIDHAERSREIESERETAYLLKSPAMKDRLLRAMKSKTGIPFDEALAKLGI